MADDCVNHAATLGKLPDRECSTTRLNVHGFDPQAERFGALSFYGSEPCTRRRDSELLVKLTNHPDR
jgi:hypothetical protein